MEDKITANKNEDRSSLQSGALSNSTGSIQLKRMFEIRAGKMYIKGNMVHPDPRPGLLFAHSDPKGKIHFCWQDLKTQNVEDDFVLVPGSTYYRYVPECTTGHVYLLHFKPSQEVHFYWIQDPDEATEREHFHRINDYLVFFR